MQNKSLEKLWMKNKNYITLVKQASNKIPGFSKLFQDMERDISITGKSKSTLTNYSRQLAHLALHYNKSPLELDAEQVMDYLYFVKRTGTDSATFFKFTVYSLRYACRMRGLEYKNFSLPPLSKQQKLPVVLNASEIKELLKSCKLLKHRLIIGLCYGCGLRCSEVRNIRIADIDLERGMLHIRQSKGCKDRYLPLGQMLCRGIKLYLSSSTAKIYLIEGNSGKSMSQRGIQLAVSGASKRAGIKKSVHTHTLRHSFATHLLEQGVNILLIKKLLGHSNIETTMVYLHIAKPIMQSVFSPLDTLYNQN